MKKFISDKKNLKIILDSSRKNIASSTLDFSSLGLSEELTGGFMDAFEATLGGLQYETQKIAWRHLGVFSYFLREAGISKTLPLPPKVLSNFSVWVGSETQHDPGYKSAIVSRAVNIVSWCFRNTNGLISPNLRTDFPRLHRRKKQRSISPLKSSDIKLILKSAYEEIDEVTGRIRKYRNLELQLHERSDENKIEQAILAILKIRKGLWVSYKELSNNLNLLRFIQACGGLDSISRYFYPSSEDIFPFYLAVLCQSSANPMAMRELKIDCIKDHPIREDRQRLVWKKNRSGYEQKADFSLSRPRSAPNLLHILAELNEPLRKYAPKSEKEKVFLAYRRGFIGVPSWQSMHNLLQNFIDKHKLPKFVFKDLRVAGANLHRQAAGSILAAKHRLNHRSSKTTLMYLSEEFVMDENNHLIHDSQEELLARSINFNSIQVDTEVQIAGKAADTVFGFKCQDPFGGRNGSSSEHMCTNFTGCATCPGAIIPLDDVAVISKLMKTQEQLHKTRLRATEEGWLERYIAIYQPTQEILESVLLRVSVQIKKEASEINVIHPILHLE